jgi:hypothetical protein
MLYHNQKKAKTFSSRLWDFYFCAPRFLLRFDGSLLHLNVTHLAMQQRDGVGAIQQHQDVLKAVDSRRKARHDQLNALGYSQLVEGFSNVAVSSSPRQRWNGHQQASSSNGGSRGYSNGALNSSNHHHYSGQNSSRSRPAQGGRGGGGNGVGRGGFAGPKGKSKERVLTPTGDIIAANEDPEEETRKKELKIQAFDGVYDPHEETLRNDLSQNYLNTGRRPQNMLQGVDLDQRFKECAMTIRFQFYRVPPDELCFTTLDILNSKSSSTCIRILYNSMRILRRT